MDLVEIEHLSREFRSPRRYPGAWGALRGLFSREHVVHRAVRDVSFRIRKGEAVAFVGPNGAGKSTTLKMLTGILVPTSGTARVFGEVPHLARREIAMRLGVVFGQRSQLWWDLPLHESFTLHRSIYRIPDRQFAETRAFCDELLELRELAHRPVRQLSLGQRMRAEVALALLHRPELLFLDEPTIGLDVLVKDRIRRFLRQANRELGTTLILTTHDLRDIEEICPRLIVIDRGRLIWDGTITALKSKFEPARVISVVFAADPGPITLPNLELVADDGRRKDFRVVQQALGAVLALGELARTFPTADVSMRDADLESVIRSMYAALSITQPGEADEPDTSPASHRVPQ